MVFALETQHGKMFRWGVRIEEMLIVHEDRIEIISNFPVQQITVVDPMPGYGAHRESERLCRSALLRCSLLGSCSCSVQGYAMVHYRSAVLARRPMPTASVPRPPTRRSLAWPACRFRTDSAFPPTRIDIRSPPWGLNASARGAFASDNPADARRCALEMKLGLLEQPIAPAVLEPLLAAWRDLVDRTGALVVVRSSALVEDRFGSSFAGQFESYLGIEHEEELRDRRRVVLGGAVVHARAALHGDARSRPGGHGDGRPGAAARPRSCGRRWAESHGRLAACW